MNRKACFCGRYFLLGSWGLLDDMLHTADSCEPMEPNAVEVDR